MKRYWILLFCLLSLSCANQNIELSDFKASYEGGEISTIDDKGDCFISITGPINKSLVPAFDKALKNITHRDCFQRMVMVNSHGGDIEVAMHMGREIREHELNTDMHGYCESACIFIYIGGVKRYVHLNHHMSDESKFGVHQPASELLFHQCVWDPKKFPQIMTIISQYLSHMLPAQADKALKQAIFETPCDQIKYIDAQEMLNTGVATENLVFH